METTHEGVVNGHHSSCIVELSTIVRGAKQRDQLPLCKELVPVFHHLVSSADQVYVVFLVKRCHYFLTKCETHSSIVLTPALYIFVGIGPEEVTQQSRVWNISRSHYSLNLLKTAQFWAQTSMHAQNLLIDYSSNWQTVETISEGFPKFYIVSSLALVIEPVNTVDGCTLVISPQQKEVLWILDFVSQQ